MIHLWFILLIEATRAAATNSTTSSCHPIASSGTTRTLWSILGSCALTMIICVWQAIHPDFPRQCTDDPEPYWLRWDIKIFTQIGYICFAFLTPELMVLFATTQWLTACSECKKLEPEFRRAGYQWSTTHCLFAEMNGFVYCDEDGSFRTINSFEFLELCRNKKVANPVITKDEIDGLSKSDWLGKIVLVCQLLWFISQVGARHFSGLIITLVELDSVCMAVLTVVLILSWWMKPLRPTCPHIFYSPQYTKVVPLQAPKEEPRSEEGPRRSLLRQIIDQAAPFLSRQAALLVSFVRSLIMLNSSLLSLEKSMDRIGRDHAHKVERLDGVISFGSLYAAWFVFGALHLAAWNFPFLTQKEKTAWRVASVILTASPIIHISLYALRSRGIVASHVTSLNRVYAAVYCGLFSRLILAVLMLISLRSLPCSAYEVVPWTTYIPHL